VTSVTFSNDFGESPLRESATREISQNKDTNVTNVTSIDTSNGHKLPPQGMLIAAFNRYLADKEFQAARSWIDNHQECDWTEGEQRLAAAQRAQEVGE
jgi:hypothetical protein